MGRAEKRVQNRRNRIESKKNKITLSRKELAQYRDISCDEAETYTIEALMTCFALAEYQVHNFSQEQIQASLNHIDELMNRVYNEEASINDYKRILEDEVGIKVRCVNEQR